MKRLLALLFGFRAETTVIDLPGEWGQRLRLAEVRGLLMESRSRAVVQALAQVLWMNRSAAERRALDAAATAKGNSAFHLGEIEGIKNVLADIQRFMAVDLVKGGRQVEWTPSDEMKMWFRAEEV